MRFLLKYLYLLAPLLALLVLVATYLLIQINTHQIPEHKPAIYAEFSAEDYLRHINVRPFDVRELHLLLLKRTKQKPGVYLENLPPLLDSAGIKIVHCFHEIMGDDYVPVITSGNDYPYHKRNSKHYFNAAMDFRIKDVPIAKRKLLAQNVQLTLGERFKVILETGEALHLHIELVNIN